MKWEAVKSQLLGALKSLNVHEIYLIDIEENILTLSVIIQNADHLRPITRMKIVDELIEKHLPKLYKEYLFCYEIWTKKEWQQLPVKKFFDRVSKNLH